MLTIKKRTHSPVTLSLEPFFQGLAVFPSVGGILPGRGGGPREVVSLPGCFSPVLWRFWWARDISLLGECWSWVWSLVPINQVCWHMEVEVFKVILGYSCMMSLRPAWIRHTHWRRAFPVGPWTRGSTVFSCLSMAGILLRRYFITVWPSLTQVWWWPPVTTSMWPK